jgi:DeoR family transcriptional regulator, fructose operon transcriptional repressor
MSNTSSDLRNPDLRGTDLRATDPRASRFPHERQHEIYLLALRHGTVDVSDLARQFDVTTETIRRDLSELQTRQLVRRVHGGAVPVERQRHEPMVEARGALNGDEKLRIAQKAILQIPAQGSVIIDSGSTGQRFADVFPATSAVQVVTNSLTTALTLARRGVDHLSVLGGSVRTNTFAMVDASVVEAVRRLRADVLFISCDGFSMERGLTTPYREEALVKRAMIESSRWVVALVDHSKFGNDQMFGYAGFDDIDVVITDSRVSDEEVQLLESHDIEVVRG